MASTALIGLYDGSDDPEFREAVARVLALHGDGEAILTLYRRSTDSGEKARLVAMLRMVGGDAAEQVFVDILESGERTN